MTLSRIHMCMLAVVGIFTGMIAPGVTGAIGGVPYPLTNMQIPTYLILLSLGCIFALSSTRKWSLVRGLGVLVLILLGYLLVMSRSGKVVDLATNQILSGLGWGWIFLIAGAILLCISMFSRREDDDVIASMFDGIIGWVGAFTIFALTLVIVLISFPRSGSYGKAILERTFGSGNITTLSGVSLSSPYTSVQDLVFDRKRDSMSFFTSSGGTGMVEIPSRMAFDRPPYARSELGNTGYYIMSDGIVMDQSGAVYGKALLPQSLKESILMLGSGNTLMKIDSSGVQSVSGQYETIEDIVTRDSGRIHIWKSETASGYVIYRDGKKIGGPYATVSNISSNSDGSSVMWLTQGSTGTLQIIKNGDIVGEIGNGYIEGTLRMNGSESLYAKETKDGIVLVHNGSILDRKFDEIREVFLEDNGNGYMYFGRPLGEQTYCLYTRYRGNLCGLTGYMNPRKSPDGSSVIYAGLKDGQWGIYRNISPIIKNTGYPNTESIARDYAYYDLTNPNYYVLIHYTTDGYRLYKRGAWIDGLWEDVGLDTQFGYDGKVLMSVKDKDGWRVIEF